MAFGDPASNSESEGQSEGPVKPLPRPVHCGFSPRLSPSSLPLSACLFVRPHRRVIACDDRRWLSRCTTPLVRSFCLLVFFGYHFFRCPPRIPPPPPAPSGCDLVMPPTPSVSRCG